MSPSRSATAVTRAAPAAAKRPLARRPSIQRWLSLSQRARPFAPLPRPPWRSMIRPSTRPSRAPCSASTAIVTWPTRLLPTPSSRKLVVSWIARTSSPATRDAVPDAACSTIFSTVTLSFRRNRPIRTSPARLPPSRRIEIPRGPCLTRRSCKNRYDRSTRRSPKNATAPTMLPPPLQSPDLHQTQRITKPSNRILVTFKTHPYSRCVHAVAGRGGRARLADRLVQRGLEAAKYRSKIIRYGNGSDHLHVAFVFDGKGSSFKGQCSSLDYL